MTDFLFGLASPIAYLFVFLFLILCGLGNPVPEDTILIAAGYLAYAEVLNIYYVLGLCYIGILCGDLILYSVGRKYGQKIINHPKFLKLIPVRRVDKIRRGFHKWGHWMIFFARFLVGFRSPTFLLAGVMKVPWKRFIIIDCLGGLVSVPLFVGLGYLFGSHVDELRHDMHKIHSWVIAVVIGVIAIFFLWRWLKSRKEDADLEPVFLWEPHLHEDEKKDVEKKKVGSPIKDT